MLIVESVLIIMHRAHRNICDLIGFVIIPLFINRGIFEICFTEVFVTIVHLKNVADYKRTKSQINLKI